jgi:hypothetical protein
LNNIDRPIGIVQRKRIIMAYDKKTGIDAIAKRKPYTEEFLGKMGEYRGVHQAAAATGNALSQFRRGDTIAQMTMILTRNGKLRRDTRPESGNIVTNFASRTSARTR